MHENSHAPLEIERKFLIRMPCVADLAAARVWEIKQTYLTSPRGLSRRVRKIREADAVRYIYTEKVRLSPTTAEERECELTEAEYTARLTERDPDRRTVEKTRYLLPCEDGHIAEVDS